MSKSLYLRIKKICSFYTDYLHFSRLLTTNLVSRGYDLKQINKISKTIGALKRQDLLPYKKKLNFSNTF